MLLSNISHYQISKLVGERKGKKTKTKKEDSTHNPLKTSIFLAKTLLYISLHNVEHEPRMKEKKKAIDVCKKDYKIAE